MRYPFVPVAIAYALGILFADFVRLSVAYLSAAAIVAVIATIFWKRAAQYLTYAALFLTGAAHLTFTTTAFAPNDLRYLLGN